MFSLEPLTFSGAGSPQIFQAGEVYQGRPLHDFQHPHDLLMELSAQYTLPTGERATWYAYVGYPGFTFYSKPDVPDAPYGRHPTSYKLFLRIRPGRSGHGSHN